MSFILFVANTDKNKILGGVILPKKNVCVNEGTDKKGERTK
jgi:hypothetical protein